MSDRSVPQNVDMAVDTGDEVLVQLRKLREGAGLKRDRLKASGAVLSALATSDPEEAMQQLQRLISTLDEQDRSVLSVDLGLELESYLDRPATPQEERWLGARRSAYGLVVGRDAKTLVRRCVAPAQGETAVGCLLRGSVPGRRGGARADRSRGDGAGGRDGPPIRP